MKLTSVPSTWLQREGRRLDCGPYLSGAIEARGRLATFRTEPLRTLTNGPYGGIYRPPIFGMKFAQNIVGTPEHGVPFLTSSSMLVADLTALPLVSRRLALSPKYAVLRISPGMTLVSCSGTVGKLVYAGKIMDGMWSSQAIMKIVPDPEKILSGYLFAFLSSRYGVPLIARGTYGAIVPQIEREHLLELPIPRLGNTVEHRVHELVEQAATARTEAAALIARAGSFLIELLSLSTPRSLSDYDSPYIASASPSEFIRRGDGYYYAPLNMDARRAFDSAAATATVGEVAEVFIPGIFKRRFASDPAYGVPYITGGDVFELSPTTDQFLLKRIASDVGLVLRKGMIVIQEAGQLGGIIGRSVLVGAHLDGFACSNNMVRITAKDESDIGYLFAVLASTYGVRLISREAAGSSIPHIEAGRVRALSIPWPEATVRARIGKLVMDAQRLRDEAVSADREARSLVEMTLEKRAVS